MEENIRVFIAIELSPQVHKDLAALESSLKMSNADVKWVEPENIHLTLKFLGDLKPDQIRNIGDILGEAVAGSKAFELTIKGIGAFPSLDSPRVVWVGVDRGEAELARIAEALETKLLSIGIPKEDRKFHPHLTLGRVRSLKNIEKLRQIIEVKKFEPGSKVKVEHITLFKSQLTPQGSIYSPLFKANIPE